MPFTGKSTYAAGATLPEIAEDVSDLVGIVSPFETPLLDALGDPLRVATSTRHEWLEDSLLPNTSTINDPAFSDANADQTLITLATVAPFQVGDQAQGQGSAELLLVTAVDPVLQKITVVRAYAGTAATTLTNNQVITTLGNAALEGADAPAARFTNRTRHSNFTQIFSSSVQVSGTELAVRQLAIDDEMDYQKQNRLRELLRDLENSVINGGSNVAAPQGSNASRRTMQGLIKFIAGNTFTPGVNGFPAGVTLSEPQINYALRQIWQAASSKIDLIVCGGAQKRRINSFITTNQRFTPAGETYKNVVSVYESDFGVCRVVMSRWVPQDVVLLLDSSRIGVLPLAGRSFHFKPLAPTGDFESGEVIGEYTLELKNPAAHGIIRNLSTV